MSAPICVPARASRLSHLPVVYFADCYLGEAPVPFHEHPGTELVLLTAGKCALRIQEILFEGQAGTLFVLPAQALHNQEPRGPALTSYANFSLPRHTFNERPRTIAVGQENPLTHWLEQLADFERSPVSPLVRGSLALAVSESLNQLERRATLERILHPGLIQAIRHIETDLLEELTVNDLSRATGLSPSHLTSLFRERFACGPIAYQQQQRLELACRLLRNGNLAVAEVAASCGYADANYFSRLFRQRYGCSPRAWRLTTEQGI